MSRRSRLPAGLTVAAYANAATRQGLRAAAVICLASGWLTLCAATAAAGSSPSPAGREVGSVARWGPDLIAGLEAEPRRLHGLPAAGRLDLHIVAARRMGHARAGATYRAAGFAPGESVAVSWGASPRGIARADARGIVTGAFPPAGAALRGRHAFSLYGLTSRRAITRIVGDVEHRSAHRRHAPAPAPLLLGLLPGPIATLSPPRPLAPVRVPVSAAAVAIAPCAAVGLALRRRRGRPKTPAKSKRRRGKRK